MTTDQLAADSCDHLPEIERVQFLSHVDAEHDLEKKVAEFLLQVDEVAALDGVHHLVGLFECVRRDGLKGLFQT